jgi:hypothetical protein
MAYDIPRHAETVGVALAEGELYWDSIPLSFGRERDSV